MRRTFAWASRAWWWSGGDDRGVDWINTFLDGLSGPTFRWVKYGPEGASPVAMVGTFSYNWDQLTELTDVWPALPLADVGKPVTPEQVYDTLRACGFEDVTAYNPPSASVAVWGTGREGEWEG